MIRHDPFFFVLVSQKSGLCALQVCKRTLDSIGYDLAFKKQAGRTEKWRAAFRSVEFPEKPISKKPEFLKNDFKLMHATLKAIGSRWAFFPARNFVTVSKENKKLCHTFQGNLRHLPQRVLLKRLAGLFSIL